MSHKISRTLVGSLQRALPDMRLDDTSPSLGVALVSASKNGIALRVEVGVYPSNILGYAYAVYFQFNDGRTHRIIQVQLAEVADENEVVRFVQLSVRKVASELSMLFHTLSLQAHNDVSPNGNMYDTAENLVFCPHCSSLGKSLYCINDFLQEVETPHGIEIKLDLGIKVLCCHVCNQDYAAWVERASNDLYDTIIYTRRLDP